MQRTLGELAELLGAKVVGDANVVITGVSGLDEAGEGQITFLANPKYAGKVATTHAAAVIVPPGADTHGRNALEIANPYLAFAKTVTLFHVQPAAPRGVMPGAFVGENVAMGADVTLHPGAVVCDGATLGNRVTLHPGAVVYEGAVLGDDVVLHANVSIRERCRLGNRVVIHNGTVVGSDGFGYAFEGRGHYKIPQVGIVVVEDDVEIGANATIDRAAMGATLIRKGSKIDNLVQIGHNCVIGEHCLLVSQVGVSGSTKLGDYVTLGGQVGVAGHLQIGPRVMIGAKSGVHNSVAAGEVLTGIPAMPHKQWLRSAMAFPKLPEMRKTISSLEKRVAELEELLAKKVL